MLELGKEAKTGGFNRAVTNIGNLVASGEMGRMIAALGNMAAAGGLKPSIDTTLALVASGKLNATIKPVIKSAQGIDLGAIELPMFMGARGSMDGVQDELVKLEENGGLNPLKTAFQTMFNGKEVDGVSDAMAKLLPLAAKYSTLADLIQPEVVKAINDAVVAGGKLLAAPSVQTVINAGGSLASSGKINKVVTAFGSALSDTFAPAVPLSISDTGKPLADAIVKALGQAIDNGQLDGPIKAMRAMAATREFGALKTTAQAMQKLRAYTDIVMFKNKIRASKTMVNTNKLVDSAAGVLAPATLCLCNGGGTQRGRCPCARHTCQEHRAARWYN